MTSKARTVTTRISIPLGGFFFLATTLATFAAHAAPAKGKPQEIENSACFECHTEVEGARFEKSIHGTNRCTSCHDDITALPHENTPKKVSCANCHRLEQQVYANSDHGKAIAQGVPEAASCKACHGDNHYLLDYRNPESPVHRSKIVETCAKCHADEKKMAPYRMTVAEPYKSYLSSIHGKAIGEGRIYSAVCTDCHGSHDLHGPTNDESRIYKLHVPGTCGKCHDNVLRTYNMSIHAKALVAGVTDAPVCTDCHGEHTIDTAKAKGSTVNAGSIVKTCNHCHASEKLADKYGLPTDVGDIYLKSYHGTAYQYGAKGVANCASCHGFHDVLPSSDPRSAVAPENLSKTCGKCHPGASKRLAMGTVHVRPTMTKDRIFYIITVIYVALIAVVIGGMVLHNILDLKRKMRLHRQAQSTEGAVVRLTGFERFLHVILLLSFILLVYTGFAHRYPDSIFSFPFNLDESWGPNARKLLHRISGFAFIGMMAIHAWVMLFTKRGRRKLVALLPRFEDVKDVFRLVRFNLGLRKERPKFARFSYIEKAEYWALIWGAVVMIATGLILMFENFSLSYFPMWFIDVMLLIHFFEAVLASLAILVWHFYWVVFDPDVYPMNWSWLTGKLTKHQLHHERKDDAKFD